MIPCDEDERIQSNQINIDNHSNQAIGSQNNKRLIFFLIHTIDGSAECNATLKIDIKSRH